MLERALLFAARTPRSQAYVQAMATAGLAPGRVLICGEDSEDREAPPAQPSGAVEVALPDLTEPLEATCAAAGWPVEAIAERDVNSPAVLQRLAAWRPSFVIYSGFGAQIVGEAVLAQGIAFLHAHSGWLPAFRGSTTIYYSMLEACRCAASVLVLARGIDEGPVLARRHYALPPAGLDVDRLYDAAIRADLMCRVLGDVHAHDRLPMALEIEAEPAGTYFVIHPVLKHLALLSLPGSAGERGAGS